jgi:hypothetical protein
MEGVEYKMNCKHQYEINSYEAICMDCGKTKGENIQQENTQLKADLQALRELLKDIEGRGCDIKNPHYEQTHCPVCGNVLTIKADTKKETAWFIGHAEECKLKAELDKIEVVE